MAKTPEHKPGAPAPKPATDDDFWNDPVKPKPAQKPTQPPATRPFASSPQPPIEEPTVNPNPKPADVGPPIAGASGTDTPRGK